MSERPTPETDAAERMAFAQEYMVPTAFARKLERERDQAREAAAKWESSFDAMERAGSEQARRADENREWALRAERECDEAREKLARIESLLLDPHAVFFNFLHGKIAKLDWAKLEHIHGPHPARVECDEARELCRELSDLVAYGLGQHGSFWSLAAMRQATTAIQKTKQMGTLPTD